MKSSMVHKRRLDVFVGCVLLVLADMGRIAGATFLNSLEDFEDTVPFQKWTTGYMNPFRVLSASTGPGQILGAPTVDATTGTAEGRYCIAGYETPSNISWLFSSCYLPSNPQCTLQFSGIINIEPDELFYVCITKQCNQCQLIVYNTCFSKQNFSRTTNWTVFDYKIGYSPTPFDISFAASLHHNGSFVALDDIKVINCQSEKVEPETCGENDVYLCHYNNDCISRDELCDLHPDCHCGEDENDCETIPPEGMLKLTDCNLDDGSCLWYNAYEQKTPEIRKSRNDVINEASSPDTLLWQIVRDYGATPVYADHITNDTLYADVPYMKVNVPSYPRTAILRSVSMKPQYTGDGLCQIRFHYMLASDDVALQLELLEIGQGVEEGEGEATSRILWETSTTEHGRMVEWRRQVVALNPVPIDVSYVLQFKVTSKTATATGHTMIHSVTLGEECFTPDVSVTTCGSTGPKGPRQEMCDNHYMSRKTINVVHAGHETGVQAWTVPETRVYRIQAYGARGGWGKLSKTLVRNSRGTKVTASFKLEAGTQLFFLVGQAGMEACPENTWNNMPPFCLKNAYFVKGGGGGGGGATFVYQKDSKNKVKILVVAGGGGGLPFNLDDYVDVHWNNYGKEKAPIQSSVVPTTESGHKDARRSMLMEQWAAEELFHRPLGGGHGCSHSTGQQSYWGGDGGFGAGGGACSKGGHGGGAYVDGFSGLTTDVGLPGLSFVHSEALSYHLEDDSHGSDGMAYVESLSFCPCAYRCMWKGPGLDHPVCLCPKGFGLHPDGFSCQEMSSDSLTHHEKESHITIIILAVFIVFAAAFTAFCICAYMRRSSIRNGLPIRSKKTIQILCPCLNLSGRPLTFNSHVLPQITHPPAVMHENSIYNRLTTKSSDQVLNEISRKYLKLVSELGQGAFGEVFYGLLSHVPMVEGELPVAVKTLPVVCTEQAEMDFLLEALIVSKFNHPNIVKYLGNCFDQHPHYLVLELLEGGDVKSFLHQVRPKRDVPSTITVMDLLRLSLDIARGCQYLEEKHFIHRDIAARNCLLTTKGPNRIAKIADFGMARDLYRSNYYKKAGRAMLPVKWMPPEAFLDGTFNSKTDVWAYGILLWEIFSLGHMPYPGCSNEEVMNLVTKGGRLEPPAGCLPSVFDIMTSCWATVAETRPNFGLIISVLERTIQDDETSSNCLPFYYTPPVIHSKRVCVKHTNHRFTTDVPRGACSHHHVSDQSSTSRHSKLQTNFEKEQSYLEPLISRTTTSDSSASKHVFLPT